MNSNDVWKGQTHRFARTALMVANGAVVCGRILVELENIKMRFWKAQLPQDDHFLMKSDLKL
jgi:hypothetical protein